MKKGTRRQLGSKTVRRHYIAEWLDARGLDPMDLLALVNEDASLPPLDRSTVYRWVQGQMPQPTGQQRIAQALGLNTGDLLHDPDHDWVARFLEGRPIEERERIKQAMELSWPKPPDE